MTYAPDVNGLWRNCTSTESRSRGVVRAQQSRHSHRRTPAQETANGGPPTRETRRRADTFARQGLAKPKKRDLDAVTSLEPSHPHADDVTHLAQLANLTELHIDRTHASDLAPLSALTSLTELHAIAAPLSGPTPLSALVNLTHLNVRETNVRDLTPLGQLANLTGLDLFGANDIQYMEVSRLERQLPQLLVRY